EVRPQRPHVCAVPPVVPARHRIDLSSGNGRFQPFGASAWHGNLQWAITVWPPSTRMVGDNGRRAPELAAGIARVKSAKSMGVRTGNWLTLKQAQALLNAPDITTTKGLRDRAILAVLLGCGLRRSEVAALTMWHIQQRD